MANKAGAGRAAAKLFTGKQMGDACEMLVAAEVTLAGIPALKVPDNWPGYDVIGQPAAGKPIRFSVKSRTYKDGSAWVTYDGRQEFEWLAIVLLSCPDWPGGRRVYVVPREVADSASRVFNAKGPKAHARYFQISHIPTLFAQYENNFGLELATRKPGRVAIRMKKARGKAAK